MNLKITQLVRKSFPVLLAAVLSSTAVASDLYTTIGHGFRGDSGRVAAGWLPIQEGNAKYGVEVEYASMGKQPDGYNNINRMASIYGVVYANLSPRIVGYGKVGANNTKWSHNGTNTYDREGDSLWGWQVSAGLETPIYKNLYLQGQVTTYEYRQVNNPNMGGYTYPSIGLRYVF